MAVNPDVQSDYEDALCLLDAFVTDSTFDEAALASAFLTVLVESCENRDDLKELRNTIWRLGVQVLEKRKCEP